MNSKSLLHHITIASLLLCAAPLHAAQQLDPQQEVKVYDYTLKHHLDAKVSNEVSSLDDLDLDDIPLELKALSKANNSEGIQQPNLLALVLEHKTKESYTKYLFASTGLLENKKAVEYAHNIYGYHLVKGYSNHFILGVLTFLHQLPDYNMHTVVVHQSQPICTNCNLITIHLFKQKLSSSKKGCHGKRFPKTVPKLASACFHSARFTQQQRQLSTLVDHFPKPQQPKKDISSNAYHRKDEILIPANGQCLYTTLLLGYLLPAITNPQECTRRYKQLTGKEDITFGLEKLVMCAANIDLLRKSFECKQLVKEFMAYMHFETGKWGGKEEIQKIADYLHVRIQEYIPNPENPTERVRSDLTSPQDATATLATTTIHIVRDNPLIKEALEYSESLQTAYHQQHYRLLARFSKLSKNNSAALTTSEEKDDEKDEEKVQASCPQKKEKTKKEALIAHLKKSSNVNETEINNFKQWLDSKNMDTDAIIEDLKDEAASNIQGYGKDQNLEIYQKIKDFFFPQNDAKLTSPDKADASPGEKTAEIQPHHLDQVHVIPSKEEKLPSASDNESIFILDPVSLQCEGHTNRVTSVSWSLDGTRLASASWDKSVCIWDGTTGKKLNQCTGHTRSVNSVNWSPDGKYLASASDDKSVRIWNVTNGKQFKKISHENVSEVSSVSWSPNGKYLASGSGDILKKNYNVHIWDVANGKQAKEISHEHLDDAPSVSWSPNGKKIAFTSANIYTNTNAAFNKKYAVFIWEGTTDKVRRFAGHTDSVNSVSWSPDGKYLASASDDKSIRIWDVAMDKKIKKLTGHTACVNSVSWSPDGKYLASGSGDMFDKDYSVRVWNAANGNQLQKLTGHAACVNSVSWSPDGKRLASASGDKNNQEYGVRIWTVTNIKGEHENNSLHLACLSGNRSMVTCLLDAYKIDIESRGRYQRTPFLCAAEKGHLETAKLLKKRRADIHAIDACKNNALHWACFHSGSEAMVTWLLDDCKIGLETKGEYQKTSFLFAAQEGQLAIAKLLKKRGANINAKSNKEENALQLVCARSGSEAMVTWLLDTCKIGIESKDKYEITPFLCAAKKGKREIAKLLKERGANIHAKSKSGNNALHFACYFSGSEAMVTWLLDVCKIGLETKGQHEMTPLLSAVQGGDLAIAKLLKNRGANIHAKSKRGNNALHFACLFSGSEAMLTWLLDVCKIDIESKGQHKMTPFLCAAKEGKMGIAKLLKKRGAKIDATDKNNKNAFDLLENKEKANELYDLVSQSDR